MSDINLINVSGATIARRLAALEAVVEAARGMIRICICGGTGLVDLGCRFCGDSTYDHECANEVRECTRCAALRTALAALSPAPEVTHECDQCGEKTGADWTSWQCPGGSGGFGSCDGKMVPLSPGAGEGERSIDECPICGRWMPAFGGEVFDGTTETCSGCKAEVTAIAVAGQLVTEATPSPWDPRASRREP